jgi:hypothetical protein
MDNTEKIMQSLLTYGQITQGKAIALLILRSLGIIVWGLFILFLIDTAIEGLKTINIIVTSIYLTGYGFVLTVTIKNYLLLMTRAKIADDQFSFELETNQDTRIRRVTYKGHIDELVTP